MHPKDDIILFHYTFSPFGRRASWFLTLAGIPYTQCLQPAQLPRPDLTSLGIKYRRIPILAHGRDIFCDTRSIFSHLSSLVPASSPLAQPSEPTTRALANLLSKLMISTMFTKAAQLIPPDSPVLNDSKWMDDRRQLFDAPWTKEIMLKNRPDSLIHIRDAFELVEDILSDGREWIAGKGVQGPGQVDIEAVWPFQFLMSLGPGALPESLISEHKYPKVYAFVDRFEKAVKDAESKTGKPKTIDGDDAARIILDSNLDSFEGRIDPNDPLQLHEGETVQVFPTDWGFSHKDTGTLISLNAYETVIIIESMNDKELRLHFPRLNFNVEAAGGTKL